MSTQVSITPSVAEMATARVRSQIFRDEILVGVDVSDLVVNAHGAEDIAALVVMLHRLGDELAGMLAAIEVPA